MTPNPDFKGATLFELRNGKTERHRYNGLLCDLSNGVVSNDLDILQIQ